MASSQVEIAPSSPFGCVLRDHNHHNGFRKRDSSALQKNFNDLVQNQLNSCRNAGGSNENSHPGIGLADLWVHQPQETTSDNNHHAREMAHTRISDHSSSDENSNQHIDYTDLWVHNPQRNNDENSHKKSNFCGKCDRARDTVALAVERKDETGVSSRPLAPSPRGRRTHDGAQSQPVSRVRSPETLRPVLSSRRRRSLEGSSSGPVSTSQQGKSQNGISSPPVSTSQTDSSAEVPNLGAVSSLVQKWRNFEGKRSSSGCSTKCYSAGTANADSPSFVEAPARGSDACDESVDIRPDTSTISEESNGDWESVRMVFSASPERDSDTAENERIRVADIIRKLSSNVEEQNDRDHAICHESLPRIRTSVDQSEQQKLFTPFSCSPRIRGRQAFCDFQMQSERERYKELEGLAGYKAVSKFSNRGRIQAMLRVRFLHPGSEVKDGQLCTSSNSNGPKQSAIVQLREIFSFKAKRCASHLQSLQGKVIDCNTEIEKSSVSHRQRNENPQKKLTGCINPPVVESVTGADPNARDINNQESSNMMEQSMIEVQRSERKEILKPELPHQENTPMTVSKGSSDTESSFRSMPFEGANHLESKSMVHNSTLSLQKSENLYVEASSGSDVIQQWSSSDSCFSRKPEFPVVTNRSFQFSEGNVHQQANNQQVAGNENELMNKNFEAQGDWEEEKYNNPLDCSLVRDDLHQLSGLEVQYNCHQQEVEVNHEWVNDVSRPRSTWEDLRQARYQEMLDPYLENDDIRCLLQRKSVSSFLSSGMRERIDRLIMSRTQVSRKDPLERESSEQERMNEEKEEEQGGEEEEEYRSYEEEEEEDDHSVVYNDGYEDQNDIQIDQHNAAKSYMNQTTSWVRGRDHEVRDDNYSNQAASPYIQQSPMKSQQNMSHHHSVEMDLIYELKGNMEQIHQEISELRRSLKSCVSMQRELQQSIKQEVAAALCQPGRQKRKERRDSSRGRCCICYEVPIDSLLYRCGHMCTCFACAHQLQWSTGKCPVCQAPILDVVRAHAQYS